ncbi:DUF4222 domain-containing protein [Escherichia coli]|jgi:hypothetical protein|uniref:DUF4222 domain-containing protein n=3 Tax=Escherichia coli TaxID=562 RepID=B7MZF4_ECO81|nr:DUF4222 domain-containing protein [Escherichia coli]ODQ12353.1 hypothetical protein BGK51_20900 [Shigella sp. FC569]EAB5457889.1 DUF4222 domain-containing protein [Escherichia coli]EEW8592020.1 DUF4222 domain-containing protein [Escherichia coli]EFE0070348.1 DUF4222 domain-containing protein [Escherichia coli]EFI7813185.1 DUF4222 domain-containing protein [Escherichia coli]
MKSKNTGLTASGKTQPEFMRGDIYRDKYGGIVMIISMRERRITYRREGYDYDCVMPVCQFRRDFSLVQAVPRRSPTSNNKAKAHVKAMKKTISRGKK